MRSTPDTSRVYLDTLGKLYERGYRLFDSCLDCAALYRKDVPPERQISGYFNIDLARLIKERGPDASCIRMAPLPCPRCGGLNTEYRIAAPPENHGQSTPPRFPLRRSRS